MSKFEQEEKDKDTKGAVNIYTVSLPISVKKIVTDISKEQLIQKALEHQLLGNFTEAEKYYKIVIENGYIDYRVLSNYGVLCKKAGLLEKALQLYKKSLEIFPDNAEAYTNIGNILRNMGKLKEAEIYQRKALAVNPYFSDAFYNLANVLRDQKKFKQAEIFARKAIKQKPDFPNAYINLGQILHELARIDEGDYFIRKGIDINFINNIDPKNRLRCANNLKISKSQFRQDLFVLSELGFKDRGYFVDIGASDGVTGSNSYLLEKHYAWEGILVEPAVFWHKQLKLNRRANIETSCVWSISGQELQFREIDNYQQLSTIEEFANFDANSNLHKSFKNYKVGTISLIDLLNNYNSPHIIDYLSIDTEGSEYEIFKDFDFDKYVFKVITCEHNFTPFREQIYDLLVSKGYKRKYKEISEVDDWYVLN